MCVDTHTAVMYLKRANHRWSSYISPTILKNTRKVNLLPAIDFDFIFTIFFSCCFCWCSSLLLLLVFLFAPFTFTHTHIIGGGRRLDFVLFDLILWPTANNNNFMCLRLPLSKCGVCCLTVAHLRYQLIRFHLVISRYLIIVWVKLNVDYVWL